MAKFNSFFLFLVLGLSSLALRAQSGLQGTVKDETGEPLVDARVELLPTSRGTLTNIDGIFSFSKVQPGSYTLRVTFVGMDTLNYAITVPPNKNLTVNLTLRERVTQLQTIEVVGQKLGEIDKIKVNPGVTKVSVRDINLIPTLGAPDLAQYLQVLPGVVFTGDQGGQLFVRGGAPIQNMVLMDGAIIYNPFHSIGLFSIFDTDYIRSVDVYSAGFSGEFGGRISSVMDLKTRNGNFKKMSGKAHVNTFTAGAMLEGPIAKGKNQETAGASYLLSARHCFLEQSSKAFYRYLEDTSGLPFNFTDLYGKVTLGSGYNQISFFGFYQRDAVNYRFPTQYNWQSYGGGTSFMFIPPSSSIIMSGNISYTDFVNRQKLIDEKYPRESKIGGFSSRFNFSYIYNSINDINFGFQILGFQTEYRFTNSMGLSANQPTNYNTEAAGYVKLKHVLRTLKTGPSGQVNYFNRLVLEPSLRLHYYNEQSQLTFEPRFRAKLNFNKISFQLASGLYSQNLISVTSDRDVVVLFQGYLTAPDLLYGAPNPTKPLKLSHTLQTSAHFLGGIQIELLANLETNIEGWYKDFNQLTSLNRERMFKEEGIFLLEKGKAYGADISLKYSRKNIYAYFTYSWQKVERDDGKIVYNPVFDRRHTVNCIGNYRLDALRDKQSNKVLESKWEFSVRWSFGSGFPFTQTAGFFEKIDFFREGTQTDYTQQEGTLQLLLSNTYNGGRLPTFHRFDFSAKVRFLVGRNHILEASLNCINLYNRSNIFYFDRFRGNRVNQLPIMPTAGLQFTF
jgi:hypothetical protein